MTTVSPFPFASLPRLARRDLDLEARARGSRAHLEPLAAALSELCEEPVTLDRVRARSFEPPSDSVGITFEPFAFVDLETALAARLVTKALKQRAPRIVDTSRPTPVEVAGAAAAVVHAALRRTELPLLRVLAAGPAPILARDLISRTTDLVTLHLRVRVGQDAYSARVTIPANVLSNTTELEWSRLDDVPIALPLVIATTLIARSDLLGLRRNDVLVSPKGITGPVVLVAPQSERGLAGVLDEGGMLRTGAIESQPWDRPIGTASGGDPSMTVEVLEDAPVVVRIELGAVEMKGREWAALKPGDVISVGRKVGDPAILRIGGVEVAKGELVQVDGEYGVKIV